MKVGGSSVLYQNYIEKNIFYFIDLLDKDNNFMRFEEITNNNQVNTNFIQYNGLIRAIKNYMNKLNLTTQENISRPIQPTFLKIINKDEKGCQTIYRILIENKSVPTAQAKWEIEAKWV